MWENQVANTNVTALNNELHRTASHARATYQLCLSGGGRGHTLVSGSRKRQRMAETQRRDKTVEKSAAQRAACTVAEELHYSPIA